MSTHRVEVLVIFSVDDYDMDQDIGEAVDQLTCALGLMDHRIYSTSLTVLTVDGVEYPRED